MELLTYVIEKDLPRTLPQVIERSSSLYPERPALTAREKAGDRVLDYKGLKREVDQLASSLVSFGIQKGDRIAILGPNSPEWAKSYLANARCGAINVPLDSLLSKNELSQLLAKARVKMAFVAPRFLDIIIDAPESYPDLKKVVCLSLEHEDLPAGVLSFKQVLEAGSSAPARFPGVEPDDLASIIFTSGTTGTPKGVMLSHWNIVSDCIGCWLAIDIGKESFLSVLPMHHTFECTAGFILPLFSGCSITFARSLKSKSIIEDLRACRATVMLGVPLLYQKMMEGIMRAVDRAPAPKKFMFKGLWNLVLAAERLGNYDLGKTVFKGFRKKAGLDTIKYFVAGGAPLPPYIPKFFRRLGLDVLQGYGLTEASPVLTINPPEAPIDESAGKPLPGVEVRVVEPDRDGAGELAFRGPMIMKGYLDNKEATDEAIDRDGWLLTGDLGFVNDQGYVFVCGRGKNLIVTAAGKNVYPEEIENELNRSSYILESMVYGRVSDSAKGEEVCAIIVPDHEFIAASFSGEQIGDERLHGLISGEVKKTNRALASYKRIKSFEIINEELPKTSTKKIKRHLFKFSSR